MRYIQIIFITFLFTECSPIQNDPPNATVVIDSLINMGNFAEAEPLIQSMLTNAFSDTLNAKLYSRYGLCKNEKNDIDSALYFYKLSANLCKNTVYKNRLANALLEMGIIYTFKRFYGEAMRCYTEALKNYNTRMDSIDVYNAICVHYINQDNYDSAYKVIKSYLNRYERDMGFNKSYYIYFGKGLYFNWMGNYDTSLIFLKSAADRAFDNLYKANTYTNISDVFKRKRNFSKAIDYLDSASLLYGANNPADNKQFDFNAYREIYDSMGNYKLAYYYAQLYRSLSDTIYNAGSKNAMINAVADANTKLERVKTAKAEADSHLSQTILIFSFIALGLVALLAFLAFRNTRIKQKANQLLTRQKQQVQQLADELAVANDTKARLFSTIGHDLRSPVSSLYASLKMQKLKGNAAGGEMSEQTVRLLDTLEELLIWSKSQMDGFKIQPVKINVRYFFEDLKDFYTTAAKAKNISIVNDTAKDVVIRADENLLKTIFRNAISNAIMNTSTGNTIQLYVQTITNSSICIAVNNPCPEESFQKFNASFNDAVVKSGAYGLGIVLMKEFAQKLGGQIILAYTDGHASLRLCI